MEKIEYFTIRSQAKKFFFRKLLPQDRAFIKEGFKKLSPKSKYQRFFSYQKELSESQLKFFSEPDGHEHVAWGVMDITGFQSIPVATARFFRNKMDSARAEVAVTVVDTYQRLGLGTYLTAVLNIIGARLGIDRFRYIVLEDNEAMMNGLTPMPMKVISTDRNIVVLEAEVVGDLSKRDLFQPEHKFWKILAEVREKLAIADHTYQ
jgi:hypothetical protein